MFVNITKYKRLQHKMNQNETNNDTVFSSHFGIIYPNPFARASPPLPDFGYLLEGELESEFEGKKYTYKKGDAFYELPNSSCSSFSRKGRQLLLKKINRTHIENHGTT
jgi:hypothetical protein